MGKQVGIVTKGPFDDKPSERLIDCACTKDGLAVHQYPPESINNWTVTHIPSGLAVARGGASRKDAIALMEKLLPLADWEQGRRELEVKKIGKDVRRIIERHGFVRRSG